jgi:hypothetical protein
VCYTVEILKETYSSLSAQKLKEATKNGHE